MLELLFIPLSFLVVYVIIFVSFEQFYLVGKVSELTNEKKVLPNNKDEFQDQIKVLLTFKNRSPMLWLSIWFVKSYIYISSDMTLKGFLKLYVWSLLLVLIFVYFLRAV